MKTLRKNTQIITDRAAIFASFSNCNEVEQQAARKVAENYYNDGSSGANAICQGVKVARRWKEQGIARVQNNITEFQQRLAQMRAANA